MRWIHGVFLGNKANDIAVVEAKGFASLQWTGVFRKEFVVMEVGSRSLIRRIQRQLQAKESCGGSDSIAPRDFLALQARIRKMRNKGLPFRHVGLSRDVAKLRDERLLSRQGLCVAKDR